MRADFSVGLDLLGVIYHQRPVSFWDLKSSEYVGQFYRSGAYPEYFIDAFLFNPNTEANLAAATYQDGKTIVFDPQAQRAQEQAETNTSILAASPDGTVLAAGSSNGVIKLYEFETLKLLWQISAIQQGIRAIVFNSNGTRFFDIRGNHCNVWEPSVLVRRIKADESSSVDYSDREPLAASVGAARTYDDDMAIVAVATHCGSDYVFCGRENGSVAAYSTKSGLVAQELFGHGNNAAIDFLAWNQRESFLASADRSSRFIVRKLSDAAPAPFLVNIPVLDESLDSVIHQILLSRNGRRLLVASEDVDTLWDLTSGTLVRKHAIKISQQPRKWITYPDSDRIFLFENGYIKSFDGDTFEDLSEQPNGINTYLSSWAVTSIIAGTGKIFAVLSSLPGSDLPPSIALWPSEILFPDNERAIAPIRQGSIARDFKAIVGMYKAWLIFLNHDGCVCSINMDTAANDKYYLRHFFVPGQWHRTLGNTSIAITQKGSVIMAVNSELVIFHNGLDFEEKVEIDGWVSTLYGVWM
jgi:WD40 repeat protein